MLVMVPDGGNKEEITLTIPTDPRSDNNLQLKTKLLGFLAQTGAERLHRRKSCEQDFPTQFR